MKAAAKEYAEEFPESVEPYDFVQIKPNGFETFSIEILEGMIAQRNHRSPKAKITVSLNREAAKVTANYTPTNSVPQPIELRIGISKDNAACFFLGEKPLSIEEATEAIMAPLLFRDIVPVKHS